MTAAWYWLLFAGTAVFVVAGAWLLDQWDAEQKRRDDLWDDFWRDV